jgi:hypothetical protein
MEIETRFFTKKERASCYENQWLASWRSWACWLQERGLHSLIIMVGSEVDMVIMAEMDIMVAEMGMEDTGMEDTVDMDTVSYTHLTLPTSP